MKKKASRDKQPRKAWTNLIPGVRKKLLEALEAGASFNEACAYIGMTPRGLRFARERDAELEKSVLNARDVGKVKLIILSRRGARKDHKHALNLLARMYPDEWAERKRLEHSGPAGGAINIHQMSDAELEHIAAGGGA